MALMALTACDFTQMPESVAAYTMHLSDYDVTVMVGDTVDVTCLFEPDSVTAPKAFWHKRSPNIAIDNADGYTCRVIGTQPGDAWVYAVTLNDNLRDSCLVHVTDSWLHFIPEHYQYDMIVVADVNIDGAHNDPDIPVGAFIRSQLRGVSEVRTVGDHTVTTFRIYSNLSRDEEVQFRYREPSTHKIKELDVTIPFDGELHDTPTSPIVMTDKK